MAELNWRKRPFTSLVVLALAIVEASGSTVNIYKRIGDSVMLECFGMLKVYTGCSSTTWIYSRNRSGGTFELISKGIQSNNQVSTSKTTRLLLQSNCSLHIKVISIEDAGIYICQQFASDGHYGEDESIYLFVLSGSVTQDTLRCSLYSFEGKCDGLTLSWSYQGTNEETKGKPGECVATLQNPKPTGLQCLLMRNGHGRETSVDFASKNQTVGARDNITSSDPGGSGPSYMLHIYLAVGVAVGAGVSFLIVAVLLLKCKKAPGNLQRHPTSAEEDNAMESTGKTGTAVCSFSGLGEADGGLTYASFNHCHSSGTVQCHRGDDHVSEDEEMITYSTVSKLVAKTPAH